MLGNLIRLVVLFQCFVFGGRIYVELDGGQVSICCLCVSAQALCPLQNKNIPKLSLGKGTIKVVRMALHKVNLLIIISSEPTPTVRTSYLEDPDGSQLLLCTFINTWTQGQDDVPVMGKSMKHLKDYMFLFLLIGQLKVFEYIFRPQHRGFSESNDDVALPRECHGI